MGGGTVLGTTFLSVRRPALQVRLIHTSSIWNCPRLFFPSGSPTLEDYYCGYGQTGVCFAPSCVPDDP